MALGLAAVVVFSLVIRVPGLRIPLDQDSSAYAYCTTVWAEGGLLYRDVWDHKPPLVYLVYRGLFLLGPSAGPGVNTTLRVGAALCDAGTVVLLALLAGRFFGQGVGLASGLVYGAFTGAPVLQLEAFQPERLVALLCTAGMLAAARYADTRRYGFAALSGLLFGLGIATKQIAAPIGVLAWAWVTIEAFRAEGRATLKRAVLHSVLLAAGAVLPWAAFAGYFAARDAFAEFWECTWRYNVLYAVEQRQGTLVEGVRKMVLRLLFDHAFLWASAAGGVVAALLRPAWRRGGLVFAAWTAMAFVALILPGQFAYYYYIPTVAPLAVCSGTALVGLGRLLTLRWEPGNWKWRIPAAVVALVLLGLLGLAAKRSHAVFRGHTSPRYSDAVIAEVAEQIRAETRPGDHIYMRGGRPQVYVLSDRRNVCPYLYDFFYGIRPDSAYLYQPQMLKAILDGLDRHRPPFIMVTARGDGAPNEVFDGAWENLPKYFPDFIKHLDAHYELSKRWPAAPVSLLLYRRKVAP